MVLGRSIYHLQLHYVGNFLLFFNVENVLSGVAVVTGKDAKTFSKNEIFGKKILIIINMFRVFQ